MAPRRIAIIGAGISGLAAARFLTRNGMTCTVFEKSRGLGGRMANRDIHGVTFDHGVQYLRPRKPSFAAFVNYCLEDGLIQAWTDQHFVGFARMTTPAHSLAEGLDVEFNYTVKSLVRNSDGWAIQSEDRFRSGYNAVLIAIPAPQAVVLLETADVNFDGIDKVRYNSCITLMLAFERQTNFSEKYIRNRSGPISWIS
jgi:predicted NAD/FAD-dependent oxidoreductase